MDLKCLKQLAMNSLLYSAMTPKEKEEALRYWRVQWEKFITWFNEHSAMFSAATAGSSEASSHSERLFDKDVSFSERPDRSRFPSVR
ncbi:MAG: hypothetical protein OEW18_02015 [Candidatus Aminicenantes bacterium]|nr:hypothetical protein [Candidatus Aminicenantes bacterium]